MVGSGWFFLLMKYFGDFCLFIMKLILNPSIKKFTLLISIEETFSNMLLNTNNTIYFFCKFKL